MFFVLVRLTMTVIGISSPSSETCIHVPKAQGHFLYQTRWDLLDTHHIPDLYKNTQRIFCFYPDKMLLSRKIERHSISKPYNRDCGWHTYTLALLFFAPRETSWVWVNSHFKVDFVFRKYLESERAHVPKHWNKNSRVLGAGSTLNEWTNEIFVLAFLNLFSPRLNIRLVKIRAAFLYDCC